MNRENAIIYLVAAPDVNNTFDELKNSFGVERSININRDLYIKTYSKISSHKNSVVFIAYSKTKKFYDLRWMSIDEPGFLDTTGKNYYESFILNSELAFKTGAKKVLWVSHLCPFVTEEDINFAFSNIGEKNMVLGPAKNKGIYLLGFTRENLKILENFYLLKENLKDEIVEKIRKNRISYMEMEEKFIVKDDESLKVWVESKDYISDFKKLSPDIGANLKEDKHKKKHKEKENAVNGNNNNQQNVSNSNPAV